MSIFLRAIGLYTLMLFNNCYCLFAQNTTDTINNTPPQESVIANKDTTNRFFTLKKLLLPSAFITYGVASLGITKLQQLNQSTRNEIIEHNPTHTKLDNLTVYAPTVLVYGLNIVGIKGKHNFKDRTIIYVTSQLIATAFITPLKHITKEKRPDGSNYLSFPSGHTTAAFSSAQFMFREYKDSNLWLSLAGYPFAIFTGVYRTLNDRHWVGDVVAGAGFGILSTEIAYWLHAKIAPTLSRNKKQTNSMITPYYQNKTVGLTFVKNL